MARASSPIIEAVQMNAMNARRTLPSLIILLAVTTMPLFSCDEDTSAPEEEVSLVPAPTIEYTRPLVYTDLTYRTRVRVESRLLEVKVAAAESTLAGLVTAGVPLTDAWVTARGPDNYTDPGGYAQVTVRLREAYPDIETRGFRWAGGDRTDDSNIDNLTRHYEFDQAEPPSLPLRVMELNSVAWNDPARPGFYRKSWWPDGNRYPPEYFLGEDWLAGPEVFIRTLVAEGVSVRNAWVTAHRIDCQFGSAALVVEVDEPHPLLGQTGFVPGRMYDTYCVRYVWNYCFEDCPTIEPNLPVPEETWVSPEAWLRRTKYDSPYLQFRAIPSAEYASALGTREQVEAHLEELLRGRVEILRAWIPVRPAGAEHTVVVVETSAFAAWSLWFWGYDVELPDGMAINDWSFVRFYDFSEEPPVDDPRADSRLEHGIDLEELP